MAHVEELDELPRAIGPGRVVAADDLPPAGNARLAAQELFPCIAKLVGLLERHGPGTNHGEIARQHVDELRQLIQGRVAKEATNLRDSRIVIELLFTTPDGKLLGSHVLLWRDVRIGDHGAKLENPDLLPTKADPLLAKKGLAWRVNRNGNADNRNGDGEDHADGQREADVEDALSSLVECPALLGRSDIRPSSSPTLAPQETPCSAGSEHGVAMTLSASL